MIFEISINKLNQIYNELKYKEVATIENKDNNEEIVEQNETNQENETKEQKEVKAIKEDIWQVEIPKIKLVAPIAEGTSQEIMLEFVGHFEDTSTWNGNIGLAAHNRGYPINYFSRLKELKKGDKIIYKLKSEKRTYSIKTIKIIEDTDWSYLKKTKDNRITLITCVANKPTKRLCIQGIEIKEE